MHRAAPLFLTLLTLITGRGSAGELAKLWEVRLSELPGSKIADATVHVFSVSFSPDGRRLAAVVNGAEQDSEILTVLSANNPRDEIKAIEYVGPIGYEKAAPAISWSSTGERIAVPEVFHALGQSGCTLEHTIRAVFYNADQVADIQPGFPNSHLLFFDTNCQPIGSWNIGGKWELSDGSADRHLLALANYIPQKTEIIIVDPLRRKLVRRWPLAETEGSWPLFADSGNAVCAIDGTGRQGVAHCWDVNGDREIAKTSSGNPHDPMATALHARRVVLSHYGWKIDFERWHTEVAALEKRVVWDFGTGQEIASWKPRYQDDVTHPAIKEPYRFAISPDGTKVAEGGAGVLTLYRIEPKVQISKP
jgi:hypothetical protein